PLSNNGFASFPSSCPPAFRTNIFPFSPMLLASPALALFVIYGVHELIKRFVCFFAANITVKAV
ncbi:MAG TPA: hypothetical protein PKL00_10710, partial [Bacillota bacterium]|nr:hypothetical protein [Bacillota bacterium]